MITPVDVGPTLKYLPRMCAASLHPLDVTKYTLVCTTSSRVAPSCSSTLPILSIVTAACRGMSPGCATPPFSFVATRPGHVDRVATSHRVACCGVTSNGIRARHPRDTLLCTHDSDRLDLDQESRLDEGGDDDLRRRHRAGKLPSLDSHRLLQSLQPDVVARGLHNIG